MRAGAWGGLGALALAGTLAGCQALGPTSIEMGRLDYNRVIQATAKEQVFANIVRVYKREPTLFVDVTEIDATVTATGTAGFSIANIGAKTPATEGATGGITYSESPLVRYFPLLGQPLVAQVSSPITAESLAYLFDSNWSVAPVMQMVVDRMTPNFADYGAALNAIIALDNYDAIVLSAYPASVMTELALNEKSKSGGGGKSGTKSGGGSSSGDSSGSSTSITSLPNDALVVYLEAERPGRGANAAADTSVALDTKRAVLHLWIRLLRIYEGTQHETDGLKKLCPDLAQFDSCLAGLDAHVNTMSATEVATTLHALPDSIELRTHPLPPAILESARSGYAIAAPILRTRSALGVMKAGAEYSGSLIRFVDADSYQRLRGAAWNTGDCAVGRDFYAVLGRSEMEAETAPPGAGDGGNDPDRHAVVDRVKTGDCTLATMADDKPLDMNDFHAVSRELILAGARAYILVAEGTPPPDAYVSYEEDGKSYYIAGDDEISKLNFALLSQLLTMQAVAQPGATATPTISVGGH